MRWEHDTIGACLQECKKDVPTWQRYGNTKIDDIVYMMPAGNIF